MGRKSGEMGMQLLGVLVLMGLGWALFEEQPMLLGWVFVGALLLQIAMTSGRMGRRFGRRPRGFSYPTTGRFHGVHAALAGRGHSRGGYSTPTSRASSVPRTPVTSAR